MHAGAAAAAADEPLGHGPEPEPPSQWPLELSIIDHCCSLNNKGPHTALVHTGAAAAADEPLGHGPEPEPPSQWPLELSERCALSAGVASAALEAGDQQVSVRVCMCGRV